MDFAKINSQIAPLSAEALRDAKNHWDSIAKPLNGLGILEDHIIKIAGLTGTENVDISRRTVVVLCADNGVVAEGVTQSDSSVTATMAGQIARHRSSICLMSAAINTDVRAYDVGILTPVEGVRNMNVARGTENFTKGPAMTRQQACEAIAHGIEIVRELSGEGIQLIVTGEMGIGNTTTSSALASVLLGLPIDVTVGRGAGLSDEGLARKRDAIRRGIQINAPDPSDALDVLHKLGGYDIAAMAGVFIGGAIYRIPVLIDGLISCISALVAARLCPNSTCAMLATHTSAEPAANAILSQLGLTAVIRAGLRLGEGTGAVCLIPMLDMALSVYNNSAAFTDTGIEQYTVQSGDKR